MISRIARFYKVSFEQFKGDWVDTFEEGDEDIQAIYDLSLIHISEPTRH